MENKAKVKNYLESHLSCLTTYVCDDEDRLVWLSDVTNVVYNMLKKLKNAKITWPEEQISNNVS